VGQDFKGKRSILGRIGALASVLDKVPLISFEPGMDLPARGSNPRAFRLCERGIFTVMNQVE
jgi:hypothetical protein